MMMRMRLVSVPMLSLLLATLSLLVAVASAEKDTDFYYPGFKNPNTNRKMYWKDSYNVLEDLDQFSALYITYHGCVHSLYPRDPHSGEDEDNEGYDYWYLDGRPSFKANSAFTLYGILKSNPAGERGGSLCHKGTYINSFFTTTGVETIAYPFGISISNDDGGYAPSSECVEAEGGDRELGEDQRELSGSGDDSNSYGTACLDGQFIYGLFDGPYCIGSTVSATVDTFDDFNAEMQNVTCRQIYEYSEDTSVAYSRSGYEGRKLEQAAYNDGYDNDGYDNDGYNNGYNDGYNNGDDGYVQYDPLDILTNSAACSLALYPDFCPDPYGLKKEYENAFQRALSSKPTVANGKGKQTMQIVSALFLALGLALFGGAYFLKKSGSRSINNVDDDAMEASPLNKPASFVHQVSSSASKKARKLKERFQDFAEAEEEEEEILMTRSSSAPPQFRMVDSPALASRQLEDEPIVQVVDSPATPETEAAPSTPEPVAASLIPEPIAALFMPEPVAAPEPVASPESVPAAPEPIPAAVPAAATQMDAASTKTKKKRPILNKISKTLFGKKKKNKGVNVKKTRNSSSESAVI